MAKQTSDNRLQSLLTFTRKQAERCSNWVELNNLLFAPGGKLMELFPSKEERSKLVKTDVYTKICEIIDSLPEPKSSAAAQLNSEDFSGRILVRLPKSVHASLAQEAQLEGVSLNQLIVAKLSVQLAAVV